MDTRIKASDAGLVLKCARHGDEVWALRDKKEGKMEVMCPVCESELNLREAGLLPRTRGPPARTLGPIVRRRRKQKHDY
jgi:hypothetical protein